ncbi:MAG: hypothetical protein K6L75_13735 [Cellvibrionaceae bacterium]
MDKSWMLNPQAIRYAKACIDVVKDELGIKLKLSHPEFLQMLHEYVDMTDSEELGMAYSKLISMAGPGTLLKGLEPKVTENIVTLPFQKQANGEIFSDEEMVKLNGKLYPKWRDGKELKGSYRGQPTYR